MSTTVLEVAQQFLSYVDETDQTLISPAQLLMYVKQGYREFVRRAQAMDPLTFVSTIDLQFNNTDSYNLADPANPVCLIGPTIKPTGAKPFFRIINLALYYPSPSAPATLINWTPAQTRSQFNTATNVAWSYLSWQPGYYLFQQNSILIPNRATASFKMTYQGDWWPANADPTTDLDDLGQFSDLIALLATRTYGVRDQSLDKQLRDMREERLNDLAAFMALGRDTSGPDRVAILP